MKRRSSFWSNLFGTSTPAQKGNIDLLNYQSTGNNPLQWTATNQSPDQVLNYNLRLLIDKSRALMLTNPYAERYRHEVAANVLSCDGMTLQMQIKQENAITLADGKVIPAGAPDTGANAAIEDAWWKFWHVPGQCDVSGSMAGLDVEETVLSSVLTDGSHLIRLMRGFDNDWNFAVQLIEVDQLDLTYSIPNLPNGNETRMGVELDPHGRRVAFHLRKYTPGDWQWTSQQSMRGERIRIPAEGFNTRYDDPALGTILCPFRRKRAGQTLGLPWLTPVMDMLNSLAKYEEAELVATRAAAEKMGFFTKTETAEDYSGPKDNDGNFVINSVPGSYESLPVGWQFTGWDPKHPNGNYGEYRKGVLRQIASGLGCSYNVLANDLEGVNYSSLRGGLLDEREIYKMQQKWFKDQVLCPIFDAWLLMSLTAGKVKLANGSALPVRNYDKFRAPYFQGRRWQWVDPLKDAQAYSMLRDRGWISDRQIIAERGGYIEDVYSEIRQDEQLKQGGEGEEPLQLGPPGVTNGDRMTADKPMDKPSPDDPTAD